MSRDKTKVLKRNVDEWGRVLVTSEDLIELLYNGANLTDLPVIFDEHIEKYNESCIKSGRKEYVFKPLLPPPTDSAKEEHARRANEWFISPEYKDFDVHTELLKRCVNDKQRDRVNLEMEMFAARDLLPLLRLMFALIAYFRKEKIVWGVGRGSSCASYCLYLMGVHRIDSLKYNLDIGEFLK